MLTREEEISIIHLWLMNPGMPFEETFNHFPYLSIDKYAVTYEELEKLYLDFNSRVGCRIEDESPIGSNPFMEDGFYDE